MAELSDIERDVLESLEIQDMIIEKMTHLTSFLERANATVTTTVTSSTTSIPDLLQGLQLLVVCPNLTYPGILRIC